MIRSMTAYARRDSKNLWGNIAWEIRSVNQRYLETYFRLPEQFRGLEPVIRERLRQRLTRGKIECMLRFDPSAEQQNDFILNEELAKKLVAAANWVKIQSDEGEINPLDILRWPGVIASPQQDPDSLAAELLSVFDHTLDEFIHVRETEGMALKRMIQQRLDGVTEQINNVRTHMPDILQWQRERLTSRFSEAQISVDNNRLEQELILLAQRLDVTEELDRLETHVEGTCHILDTKEATGRRLDFMMQEFNREANTLASKSINSAITNAAIELKVLIEQMREQIQNIE